MKMNKKSYAELINEDIEYLQKQSESLERQHIIEVLKESVILYYDDEESTSLKQCLLKRLVEQRRKIEELRKDYLKRAELLSDNLALATTEIETHRLTEKQYIFKDFARELTEF